MPAFISEEIEALFDREPALEKRTGVPDGFIWRGRPYRVVSLLREWHDYTPRGKSKAMYEKERGAYWVKASHRRGTWGVGRDYYRVLTASDEIFDIYYDRKPKGRKQKGTWILWRQVDEDHQGGENEP
ncbi:MAG: hypothetical protein H5T62_12015 [Anaerolineae bacterium]|nr:hypothetical protein [Anaerolineae bacterium]